MDITTLTPALRQQYGFTPTSGAVILTVVPGSPAAKAGLVQGDVIVNIDGTAITSSEDLQKLIQKSKPGQTVTITYYVGNSKRTTTATLGNQPGPGHSSSSRHGEHDEPLRRGRVPRLRELRGDGRGRPRLPARGAAPGCRSSGPGGPAGSSSTRRCGCHPLASMSSRTCAMLYVSSS